MDLTLKTILLQYKLESADDNTFIQQVNNLGTAEGIAVYQCILELLTSIDIPADKAEQHWKNAILHRQQLIKSLGRNVDFTTVLCDYFQTATDFLIHPRLVESTLYENVVNESIHDKLTGLFNRPYFDEAYSLQVSLAKRYQDDLTILFLDIDNFKDINDIYGHLAGDEALKRIADIIDRQKRDSDIAARFGGEEFVLLMPRTDNVSAFICAERLREEIEKLVTKYNDQSFKLTVSGGIASFPFNSESPELLLEMADNAVYLSKGAGKNRISHYKEEKRRYLRVKINQSILIKELDFHNSQTFTGISKDICVGGLLFENDEPLPLGALIKVKVPVTDGAPVLFIGTVVRVETFGSNRYEIGMTTSFKEMDKIVNTEIGSMLRRKNVSY